MKSQERFEFDIDYSTIAAHVSQFPLVGVGESTHGTHEFFETKGEVFKRLVQAHSFDTLFFETIDDHCEGINDYFQTGKGDLETLVNKLFYVWRTEEVLGLFRWLGENHDEYPVQVVGLDERKYVGAYDEGYGIKEYNLRDERMASVIKRHFETNPDARGMIWAHNAHIAKAMDAHSKVEDRRVPMGQHLDKLFKTKYYNIAQLFGVGAFSSALIEESGAVDNSKLVVLEAGDTPEDFAEHYLSTCFSKPVFVEGRSFDGALKPGTIYAERSLGWGTKMSEIDQYGTYVDFSKAYDALTFFPETSASHLLAQN